MPPSDPLAWTEQRQIHNLFGAVFGIRDAFRRTRTVDFADSESHQPFRQRHDSIAAF